LPGPGSGFVWKDAAGQTVENTFGNMGGGPILYHIDASGYLWQLDKDTGLITAGWPYVPAAYFESNNCTGEPLIDYQVDPRLTLVLSFELGAKIRVRSDTAVASVVMVCSMREFSGCSPMPCENRQVLSLIEVPGLAPPVLSIVPPLHPALP
jgi:hypothetical protein